MSAKYSKIESPFQLVNHAVKELHITSGASSLSNEDTYTIDDLAFDVIDIQEVDDSYIGTLGMSIKISCKKVDDKRKAVRCKIELIGIFRSAMSQIDNHKDFEKMLVVNGLTSLYSIARSIIISASSQCLFSGHVRLPMINVLKLLREASSHREDS